MTKVETIKGLEEQLLKDVGETISRLRREHPTGRLTQTELAQKAGITQPFLSEIESGKAAATLPVLMRICCALGVSLAEVLVEAQVRGKDLSPSQYALVRFLCAILEELYPEKNGKVGGIALERILPPQFEKSKKDKPVE